MGNKQQTPRALLELAEESLTTMTDFYYKECIVATADQSAALAMFFQSPTDDTGETKGGSSDETIPPHIVASQARTMLTNTLTSIISALLGRPISQASNKDRRATNEEKEAIAIILSTGVEEDGKKKKKIGAGKIGSGLIDKMVTNMMLFDLEAKKSLVIIMQTLVRESLPFRSYVTGSGSDDPNGLSPIVHKLVQGFEVKSFSSKHGIALFTGPMLMTIVRNDDRTASVVLENHLDRFLDEFVQSTSYDIKTIAFDTLRDLLFTVDDRQETILRTNAANYINKLWVRNKYTVLWEFGLPVWVARLGCSFGLLVWVDFALSLHFLTKSFPRSVLSFFLPADSQTHDRCLLWKTRKPTATANLPAINSLPKSMCFCKKEILPR